MKKIILASASPRRAQLLEQVGISFEVVSGRIDESQISGTGPADLVEKLSSAKARDIFQKCMEQNLEKKAEEFIVIGADTVVTKDDIIYGKPSDETDAFRILDTLQGDIHEVFTGVTLTGMHQGGEFLEVFHVKTRVEMLPLSEEQIWAYVRTGEPMDKAGAYGIQGRGAALVKGITGDYYNVVGLPVSAVVARLSEHGF